MNKGGIVMAVAAVAAAGMAPAYAEIRLPNVISSNMVLQRDKPVPVWGWAAPGEKVTVAFRGHEAEAAAEANGRWRVDLPPMPAGGPDELVVSGGKNRIVLSNVMVGEVWLASGQSNMAMPLRSSKNAQAEIAAANHPDIRLYAAPPTPAAAPRTDADPDGAPDPATEWERKFRGKIGLWRPCSPDTAAEFSAVAYFFGREIHKWTGVPVGLINASWGATRIETWTPFRHGFDSVPELEWLAERIKTIQRESPGTLASYEQPTGLFNGMIHPLIPFALRGAIWYQGEGNLSRGMIYYDMMRALINGWRKSWGRDEFPFYYVQIAPYTASPSEPYWMPEIWEAQAAALEMTNTGMAVTTDIGELGNIHPANKLDVGKRLALWAIAKLHGANEEVFSGPLYKSMRREDNAIRLFFEYAGGGLSSRDGQPLSWFEIAGPDRQYVKADASIDGASVLVSNPQITNPASVRFGWHQTAQPNLVNIEGLPASPFRTTPGPRMRAEPIKAGLDGPALDLELVFEDDFENKDTLGENWTIVAGNWIVKDGRLTVPAGSAGDSILLFNKPLPGPVRIEYDCFGYKDACDISVLMGTPLGRQFEKAGAPDEVPAICRGGYFFGFGSDGNSFSKLMRRGERIGLYTPRIEDGREHHVVCERGGDGVLRHIIDGAMWFESVDPAPLAGGGHEGLGFYMYSGGRIGNVRIYVSARSADM